MAGIQVVNYPVPNGTVADERLTVSSASVSLAAFDAATQFVTWDVQNADVMVTFDGSTPTSTNGHRLYAGEKDTWHVDLARKAKFIRATGTDGVVHASQLRY